MIKSCLVALVLVVAPAVHAFRSVPQPRATIARLHSTTATLDTEAVTVSPPETVLDLAQHFQNEFGLFLVDRSAKEELTQAIDVLEASVTDTTYPPAMYEGDWELLCTTTTTTKGFNTTRVLQFGPLKQITDRLSSTANKYVTVQQNIKLNTTTNSIDRIDHVLAYQPPQALTEFLDNVPDPLSALKINPLDVSQSKLVLVHKATAVDETNAIQLQLQSVIWNVAGNSTYLDPAGKDITSINLPWGEFLGSGTFTTTYMDDSLRVARGKQGGLDFLRVFVKSKDTEATIFEEATVPDAEIIEDILLAEDATDSDDDDAVPSDVGEAGP